MKYFYIMEKHAGEFALFWREQGRGRTNEIGEAGLYLESDVKQYRNNQDLIIVPASAIKFSRDVVSVVRQSTVNLNLEALNRAEQAGF